MLALIGNLGPLETLLIVVVVVLVFGGRLPEVARQAMRVIAKVRNAIDDLKRDVNFDGEMRQIERDVRLEKAEAFARGKTVEAEPKAEAHQEDQPQSDTTDTNA